MKKIIFICIICISTLIIFFIKNIYKKYEKFEIKSGEFFHSTYEFECNNIKKCRIYFLNVLKPVYIETYDYTNEDYFIIKSFNYDTKYYIKDDKIILYDGKKLVNKLEFTYDYSLSGTYEYNGETYKFYDGTIVSSLHNPFGKPYTFVYQMDKQIIALSEDLISEMPIYQYEFDEENNLILYPLSAYKTHMNKRLSYKLKRLK